MNRESRCDKLGAALGSAEARQQLALESLPRHLDRLCRWPVVPARFVDLRRFADEVNHTETPDGRLVRALLPVCYWGWSHDFREVGSPFNGFSEVFWSALVRHAGFEALIGPEGFRVSQELMAAELLDRMALEDGYASASAKMLPSSWFRAFCCFGIIFPGVGELWEQWRRAATPGHAYSLAQYISCLVYDGDQNPLFAGHHRAGGDRPGAPSLWEPEGFLLDPKWRDENLDFIRREWTPSAMEQALDRSCEALVGTPYAALVARVRADFGERLPAVTLRLAQLPDRLAKCNVGGW
jgi:hypothetical protein